LSEIYLHKLDIKRRFERSLKNLSKENIKRIESIINDLARGEITGRKLRGKLRNFRYLRVGSYRVIYEEPKKCNIILWEVGSRESIYNSLSF